MIVGQRVSHSRGQGEYRRTSAGFVVAYMLSTCVGDGTVESQERIVIQTDDGRFIFALPIEVRAGGSGDLPAAPAVLNSSRKCPTHGLATPSKKGPAGSLYCPASTDGEYCSWSYSPESAAARNGR
ncbi:MAG: hypothetical protein GEU75_10435 [Dehalococcoidia bacterium]|nr:hypothetical protein [Dehalococcoidia bacterium]